MQTMPNSRFSHLTDPLWDRRVPVALDDIAAKAGINIRPLGPNAQQTGISGEAFIDDDGQKIVTFNPSDIRQRQRFTIAHEIGHHLLGHTQSGKRFRDDLGNFQTSTYDADERDANAFAAELLMPETAIDFYIRRKKVYDLRELAELFNVSLTAMQYRLTNLGWL